MDASVSAVLSVFMRWLHISSAITIIGGFVYTRFVVVPSLEALPKGDAPAFSNRMISALRPLLYIAIACVLVSGLYNYLTKPSYPLHYHAVIGVKFLFVLHIFAVSVLYTVPNSGAGNRTRRLDWLVISGLAVVALSAVLRWLTLNASLVR